jgi:hypothetical protein
MATNRRFIIAVALASIMSGPAVAQTPAPSTDDGCYWIFRPTGEVNVLGLGTILLDRCSGKTWSLRRGRTPDGKTVWRWYPLHMEANEYVATEPDR